MQRRDFLKLSTLLGSAGLMPGLLAGCSAPPLPGSGEVRTRRTVCNICFWQCAATLYTENGKPWKVVGNPEDPHCNGRLCTRGTGGIASYSDPDRLSQPMIRVTQNGKQTFKPVSWDEAFETIAGKMQAITEHHGSDRIAMLPGMATTPSAAGPSPSLMPCSAPGAVPAVSISRRRSIYPRIPHPSHPNQNTTGWPRFRRTTL